MSGRGPGYRRMRERLGDERYAAMCRDTVRLQASALGAVAARRCATCAHWVESSHTHGLAASRVGACGLHNMRCAGEHSCGRWEVTTTAPRP